ncbi:MAG: stage II sporulation protein M [Oscillospiraceae bacterium]
MKKKLKKFKSPKNTMLIKNQKLIILTLIVIAGFLIGSFSLKYPNEQFLSKSFGIVENLYNQQINQTILANFIEYFFSEALFLLIVFLFGLCIIGEPFLWIIPFIRSLESGLIMSIIYQNFSLKGIVYCISIIIPSAIVALSTLIIATKESILMTKDINAIIKKKNPISSPNIIRLYLERYGILTLGTLLSALIYAITVQIFSGKFNFTF